MAEDKENFIHQKIHMHDCKWEIRKVETHHNFFNEDSEENKVFLGVVIVARESTWCMH